MGGWRLAGLVLAASLCMAAPLRRHAPEGSAYALTPNVAEERSLSSFCTPWGGGVARRVLPRSARAAYARLPRGSGLLRASGTISGDDSREEEEGDLKDGEIVIIGGQRFRREQGMFVNLDLPRAEVDRNVRLEKEAMAAEARRNSPTSSRARDDVEDGRFGDDDFDAEGADDVGVFDAVGFPETADEGAFRMGVEDPDADFGDWAHPEELGVGGDGAVAMRGGLPLDDMDDSIIKDYAEAIESGEFSSPPPGTPPTPMGYDREEIAGLQERLASALAGGGDEAAAAHHELGVASTKRGRLDEGLEHLKQALTLRAGIHGRRHSSVAKVLSDIGVVYEKMSEFSLALNFYQQASEVMEQMQGDKLSISSVQANMGACFLHLGEVQKSITYSLSAYQIQKSALGDGHPSVAAIMRNIGCAHLARGDAKKALAYLDKALAAEVAICGPMSLEAAESSSNAGMALLEMERFQEALARFEQVLDVRLNVLGERHPHVALTVKNLGHVHRQMGEPERALKYYEKALRMESDFYGEDSMHVHVAVTRCHIAQILSDRGSREDAKKLFERAAATFALRLGSNHPHTKVAQYGAEECAIGGMRQALRQGSASPGSFLPGELQL